VMKRLAEPRIAFVEKSMPSSVATSDAIAIDCGDAEKVASSMNIPAGWYPIRLEKKGDEVAGIAISRGLDPMGEVGLGAYWVLHSSDGGKSWDDPLYTGLRENMPYVVLPASKLPLMHGDRLEVEVEVHELDTSSITFPPTELRSKRDQKGLYIELPWDVLRRDSDDDGIPDLVEERLGTDPRDADTDGDGIIDGKDGLPLVAFKPGMSTESEVLLTVLKDFYLGGGAIIVGMPSAPAEMNACDLRTSNVMEPTLFLIGDRALFAPVDINRRVIVMSPEEMAAYSAKFGPTYGGDVSLMMVSHDGMHAKVEINQSWTGQTLELKKVDGKWTVVGGSSWIT